MLKFTERPKTPVITWKKNYPREEEDTKCPICNQKEDTTEHVPECQTAETVYRMRDNTPNTPDTPKVIQTK